MTTPPTKEALTSIAYWSSCAVSKKDMRIHVSQLVIMSLTITVSITITIPTTLPFAHVSQLVIMSLTVMQARASGVPHRSHQRVLRSV